METPKLYYVIDDDTDDQKYLIEALKENDQFVQCVTATNGQEALAKLKTAFPLPDVIFLDLNMPGINGKKCLVEIKQVPSLQHIPVIICSTSSNAKEIKQTMEMGAFHFLVKQSSFDNLKAQLFSVIALVKTANKNIGQTC